MRNKTGSLLTSPNPNNDKTDTLNNQPGGGTFGFHNHTFFATVSK